jgi:hypothetical protein
MRRTEAGGRGRRDIAGRKRDRLGTCRGCGCFAARKRAGLLGKCGVPPGKGRRGHCRRDGDDNGMSAAGTLALLAGKLILDVK